MKSSRPDTESRYLVLRRELERIRGIFAAVPSIRQVLVFGSLATRSVH